MSEDTKTETKSSKGSILEQLKHLPKWAYVAMAGGGVGLIILYERNKSSSNTSTVGVSSTDAAAQGLSSQSLDGYPLDSLSNLGYGYSTPQSGPITIDNSPTPTNNPTLPNPNPPTNPIPQPNNGTAGVNYPLIPYGQYNGPSYSNLAPNTTFNYNGTLYKLVPGANGRLWGDTLTPVPGGGYSIGQQILLYGPQSSYPSNSSPSTTATNGQGGGSTMSLDSGQWSMGSTNTGVAAHILDGDLFDNTPLMANGFPDLFE